MFNENRRHNRGVMIFVVGLMIFLVAGGVAAQSGDSNVEMAVLPSALERISWSAIVAGTVLALVIQLAGNLLALGVGMGRVNPNPERGEDVPSPESVGMTTLAMIGVTMLIALFIGGYAAARLAGSAYHADALLHGLLVWGLSTIVTVLLLRTTLGSVLSGLSGLLQQGLHLLGSATSGLAHGAATLGQGALNAAGKATDAASETARDITENAQREAQKVIQNNPELQRLTHERDALLQRVQNEAMQLIREAGVDPDEVQHDAQDLVEEGKDIAKSAARDVQQNPTDAQHIVTQAIDRFFARGQHLADKVEGQVETVDRDRMVALLADHGNMSRQEAEQQVAKWESEYGQIRQQGQQALQQARQEAERLRAEAEARLEEAREEAEHKARETAEAAAKTLQRLLLASFAALVIGAVASGIGGIAGVSTTIPTLEIEDSNNVSSDIEVEPVITPSAEPTALP